MTTRKAPYTHADGSNCWTKDCSRRNKKNNTNVITTKVDAIKDVLEEKPYPDGTVPSQYGQLPKFAELETLLDKYGAEFSENLNGYKFPQGEFISQFYYPTRGYTFGAFPAGQSRWTGYVPSKFGSLQKTIDALKILPKDGLSVFNVSNKLTPQLKSVIESECIRQGETFESRGQELYAGWLKAKRFAEQGRPFTKEFYLELAGTIEPNNHGRLRTTPVTFANGGYAVPHTQVERGVDNLIRFWPGSEATDDEKRYWLKESLINHGFEDGNGRLGWVLQQVLFKTWNNPQPLIDFGFNSNNFIAKA